MGHCTASHLDNGSYAELLQHNSNVLGCCAARCCAVAADEGDLSAQQQQSFQVLLINLDHTQVQECSAITCGRSIGSIYRTHHRFPGSNATTHGGTLDSAAEVPIITGGYASQCRAHENQQQGRSKCIQALAESNCRGHHASVSVSVAHRGVHDLVDEVLTDQGLLQECAQLVLGHTPVAQLRRHVGRLDLRCQRHRWTLEPLLSCWLLPNAT